MQHLLILDFDRPAEPVEASEGRIRGHDELYVSVSRTRFPENWDGPRLF
jgi:hypothetical protein